MPELSERPANAVNLDDVEAEEDGSWKRLGRAAGSEQSGLNWGRLGPDEEDDNEHCHSAEEELFVVLEGGGTIFLGGEPHEVSPGSVVARPAGHARRALLDGRPRRPDGAVLRHARAERHHLVPAHAAALLPRRRRVAEGPRGLTAA